VSFIARFRHFRRRLWRRFAEIIEDTTSFVEEPREKKS